MDNASEVVLSASAEDFKLLIAAQEWKLLDAMAGEVRQYTEQFEATPGQLDFLGLYDHTTDYLHEHRQLPPAVVKLVRGIQ